LASEITPWSCSQGPCVAGGGGLELMEDMSLSKRCKSGLKKHARKENGWSSVCMIPRVSVMSAHYSQDSG
jgi:hypothetical protein